MEAVRRVTAKGQVTIPIAMRRALDVNIGDQVVFELDPGSGDAHLQVRKAVDFAALGGSVPVPNEWADADWAALREAAWSAQARPVAGS